MSGTRIEFHLAAGTDRRARLLAACRLAEAAYRQGSRVAVRTSGPAETVAFDELLWTFADDSFVPHGTWPMDEGAAAFTPVLVGSAALPPSHRDLLINLGQEPPPDVPAYGRVCEVVGADDEGRKAGRNRWRAYREAGFEPQMIANAGVEPRRDA
jgi:DNA polymerase-3 subunit chi